MSTEPGSKPAPRRAGTIHGPSAWRMIRVFSSIRSPIPVSTRTRPSGVSMSRQLSAWSNRWSALISSPTRRSQRSRGTGPKRAPASERNVPAWTSATLNPPPRSRRQSTASPIATGSTLPDGATSGRCARVVPKPEPPEPPRDRQERARQHHRPHEGGALQPPNERLDRDRDREGDRDHEGQGDAQPRRVDAHRPAPGLVHRAEDHQDVLELDQPERERGEDQQEAVEDRD